MADERDEFLISQFYELQAKYPGLALMQNLFGEWSVKGELRFSAAFKGAETISDIYEVEILIPKDFPDGIPVARDLSGKTDGFHTNHDGSLCLGAPLAVRIAFNKVKTLVGFVDNCLIHFLYACSYKSQYGELPFGDLPHGNAGIYQYYQDFFELTDESAIMGLLRILVDADYRGHLDCPCGSGVRTRDCHGDKLRYANSFQTADDFVSDYLNIFKLLNDKGCKLPLSCFSKKLSKYKDKQPVIPQKR